MSPTQRTRVPDGARFLFWGSELADFRIKITRILWTVLFLSMTLGRSVAIGGCRAGASSIWQPANQPLGMQVEPSIDLMNRGYRFVGSKS
jgi:hypothetical protein